MREIKGMEPRPLFVSPRKGDDMSPGSNVSESALALIRRKTRRLLKSLDQPKRLQKDLSGLKSKHKASFINLSIFIKFIRPNILSQSIQSE